MPPIESPCNYVAGSNEPCSTCPCKITMLYMCGLLQEAAKDAAEDAADSAQSKATSTHSRALSSTHPIIQYEHQLDVSETSAYETLDALVERMDDTTLDGIHRLKIDRHEIRRMMKMFPSRSAKVGFFAVRWMQKPDDRVKIFAIYAV